MNLMTILKRDMKLALKRRSLTATILAAVLLIVAIPTSVYGAANSLYMQMYLALIWIAIFLSSILTQKIIFDDDYNDGSLEQIILQDSLPYNVVIAKALAHQIVSVLPIIIVTPLIAMILKLSVSFTSILMLSLFGGSFLMSLLGSVIASIKLIRKKSSIFLSLLIYPFYLPVIYFAIHAVDFFAMTINSASLSLLFAMIFIILPISIFATITILSSALEEV